MIEEDELRRDIQSLMEANREDWRVLAEHAMSTVKREEMLREIDRRTENMRPLFERLWQILDAKAINSISDRLSKR